MMLHRFVRNGAPHLCRAWSLLDLVQNKPSSSLLPHKMPVIPMQKMQYMRLAEDYGVPAETRLVGISKELRVLPGPPEQAAAAALDEHEANVVEYMVTTKDNDDVIDETLFRLLTACYVACLPDVERMWLPWKDAQLHLDCMVDFARQELLSGKTPAFCHDLDAQDEEVSGYVEDLWANFCHHRNIQVSPEGPERTTIAMDLVTLPPYRKPADEFRWRCGENASGKFAAKTPLYKGGVEVVPKFFDLANMIVESDYFHCLPVERLGWNLREFAREQPSSELSNRVDRAYSQLAAVRASECPPSEWSEQYDSAPLLVKDFKLLLEAMHSNKLFRTLTAQRPPLSVATHHHALLTCTQHARIWLARYDLKIYYDHSLTYAQLCTRSVKEEDEEMVLRDIFRKERVPSTIEQTLRHKTLSDMRNDFGGEVMHLRPEDYDKLLASDRQPWWRGFMELIRNPIKTRELQTEPQLQTVPKWLERRADNLVSKLRYETKSKKSLHMLLSHLPPEMCDFEPLH